MYRATGGGKEYMLSSPASLLTAFKESQAHHGTLVLQAVYGALGAGNELHFCWNQPPLLFLQQLL